MRGTKTPNFGQKPCQKCGQWVSTITVGKDAGRTYDNDGAWHAGRCVPDPAWQARNRLQRAEWEAKNIIKEDKRTESRGYVPPYLRRAAIVVALCLSSGVASATSLKDCDTFESCIAMADKDWTETTKEAALLKAIALKLNEIEKDQKEKKNTSVN